MIKKTLILLSILTFLNCSVNDNLDGCIQSLPLNIATDLNNPELINVNVPGGYVELSGGSKGILLVNVNGNDFVAYDKLCPAGDCDSPMTFENGILLKCQCDGSEYGVGKGIGGAPQTEGFICPAIEYNVTKIGTAIRITNF
ncbi:phosphoribosylaminoimidazole carboxylase [Polaribacter sargassicola]|uniref:phosphoribosylaminoimidazole carboxylase n=1 Tax=Polaribacter sargassicola TaxID=2836891 RepID=UPI001F3219D0|nr:phosphoribosylaminoimidazole carboxylase [Polaribacter sp. DS7-9]MCG1037565.1 phosphoribosylaminoimidazole carboxylase [Polaribacter sp. DS7-9]